MLRLYKGVIMEESLYRVMVSLLLTNEQGKVFLVRNNESNNNYGVCSSYLPNGETVFSTAANLASQKLNISINEKDLLVFLSMQILKEEETTFVFFVHASRWKGDIKVEGTYDDSMWVSTELLPLNTVDYIKRAVQCYKKNISFTVFQN